MIYIYTDHPEFFNDLGDIVRLFCDTQEVVLAESEPRDGSFLSVSLKICDEKFKATAIFVNEDKRNEYTHLIDADYNDFLEKKRLIKRAIKLASFYAMKALFDTPLPWGALTGIRPTRLMRDMTLRYGFAEATRIMREDFCVEQNKLDLVNLINEIQLPTYEVNPENSIDVYVNIPFCKTKCLFCSFPSAVRTDKTDMDAYLSALYRDIEHGASLVEKNAYKTRAMYMGGGTPTVLTANELDRLLKFIKHAYGNNFSEITVEAGRPDTMDYEKLCVLRDNAVTRISINPQTMNENTLSLIGRTHSVPDIESAFHMARSFKFLINADIIAGLPGENLFAFKRTLYSVLELNPDNITVHTLALKRSSRLVEKLNDYPLPSAKDAMSMLDFAHAKLLTLGYLPYYMYRQKYMRGNLENVGYAKNGSISLYNIDIMEETTSIIAHGANAMSKRIFDAERRVERIPNPKDITAYIDKLEKTKELKNNLFMRRTV
ncbi:MAG: coproporphyrinogen dehydrogenase HemZ [Clostridia bacterium]